MNLEAAMMGIRLVYFDWRTDPCILSLPFLGRNLVLYLLVRPVIFVCICSKVNSATVLSVISVKKKENLLINQGKTY